MGRNKAGLETALKKIDEVKKEFYNPTYVSRAKPIR